MTKAMDAIGQVTGKLAHDFNNILTVILGSLDRFAVEGTIMNGPLAEDVTLALNAAERGVALNRRLLAIAGRQALSPKKIDLNALVTAQAEALRRNLAQDCRLEIKLANELWIALADPQQIEAAMTELAANAMDAMGAGGTLTIETQNWRQDGDYVALVVSDNGRGMTAEIAARAFEPFFTTKPDGQSGGGLGLAQIYGFVRQSGGHVALESTIGIGTSVRLLFPRTDTPAEPTPRKLEAASRPVTGETILVVEDDPFVMTLAKTILLDLGYRVLTAINGQEAIAVLSGDAPIDLLFTDMVMPGMNGPQLAAEAVKLRPALKVLFTSGYSEANIKESGWTIGKDNVVTKPYRKNDLAARLREIIARKAD